MLRRTHPSLEAEQLRTIVKLCGSEPRPVPSKAFAHHAGPCVVMEIGMATHAHMHIRAHGHTLSLALATAWEFEDEYVNANMHPHACT